VKDKISPKYQMKLVDDVEKENKDIDLISTLHFLWVKV